MSITADAIEILNSIINQEDLNEIDAEILDKKLDSLLKTSQRIPWTQDSKGIVFSDLHMGVGDVVDYFCNNAELFYKTLLNYFNEGYTLFLNGDVYDLWLNTSLHAIQTRHSYIVDLFNKFKEANRFYYTSGNHDREMGMPEAVVIDAPKPILIVHGYQTDFFADSGWKLGRFITREFYGQLTREGIKIYNPLSATSGVRHDSVRRALKSYCIKHDQIISAGHIHTPEVDGEYFNDGAWLKDSSCAGVQIVGYSLPELKHFVRT